MHVKDEGLLHARSCLNRSPSLSSVHASANSVAKYSSPGIFHRPPIFQFLGHYTPGQVPLDRVSDLHVRSGKQTTIEPTPKERSIEKSPMLLSRTKQCNG